ncbi:MAG: hypothetical protein BSOLF_2187 [Candidatus Carbobacillus altaicus]|uniref:Uncharacterized protein n=1 Tax=Candidatus Carbonibacillus altaicus TaxID=2163959 RepID=A0A2R6Y3E4_9BACL|nr:MAG: hypothetical protein BSOLF_2187 [Candidatus Carbobacillus altaicus]
MPALTMKPPCNTHILNRSSIAALKNKKRDDSISPFLTNP